MGWTASSFMQFLPHLLIAPVFIALSLLPIAAVILIVVLIMKKRRNRD